VKIVKFKDGTYGVRRVSFWVPFPWFEYLDLRSNSLYWWDQRDAYFTDCQGTLAEAQARMNRATDKGRPI
jgi:hypothetical protein